MRMLSLLSCSFFSILLSSCASTTINYYPQTLQSWQGSSTSLLLKRWGHPNTTVATREGTVIYVYKTESYHYSNAATAPVWLNVSDGKPFIVTPARTAAWTRGTSMFPCYALFEAGSQGQIVKTSAQGTGCYGSYNFALQYSNPEKN